MSGTLDYPIGYRGYTLNRHRSLDGGYVRDRESDTALVDAFDFSPLIIRDQRSANHLRSGGQFGLATKAFRPITMRGIIKGSTEARLEDSVAALFRAFDVEEAQADSPGTFGASALDFWCPTEFSGPGMATVVHELFMARPTSHPVVYERLSSGLARRFAIEMLCADPRRYLYDQTVITFSNAAGWSQACPNWNAAMGAETFPVLRLIYSVIGDNDLTISDSASGKSLVLDMSQISGSGGDYSVDMDTGRIWRTSDDAPRAMYRTSDVDSYFGIPAAGTVVSISNTTGLTSATLTYRQARS